VGNNNNTEDKISAGGLNDKQNRRSFAGAENGIFGGHVRVVAIAYHGEYDRFSTRWSVQPNEGSNYFSAHKNHQERIIEPLHRIPGVAVRTYFSTKRALRNGAPCPSRDNALVKAIRPVRYEFLNQIGSKVVDTYLAGMNLVHQAYDRGIGPRDVVVLLRFDVLYRYSLTELPPPYHIEWAHINIAFKDKPDYFASTKKVSDLLLTYPLMDRNSMWTALKQSGDTLESGAGAMVYANLLNLGIGNISFIDPTFFGTSNVACKHANLPRESAVGGVPGCLATFMGINRARPPDTCRLDTSEDDSKSSKTDPWPFCAC
jgi:hypothetical protein